MALFFPSSFPYLEKKAVKGNFDGFFSIAKKRRKERETMEERIELSRQEIEKIIDTAVEKAVLKTKKEASSQQKKEKKNYLKMSEFAKEFNVGKTTVFYWILNRRIYAEQIEGTRMWRIPVEEVENFKERNRKSTNKMFNSNL
jgi:excisionase family DNA binding protein